MQCDKCGSDNTQRLEVIFEQGTSNIKTTTYGAGGGYAGLFGLGGGAATTHGTQQTVMGQKSAPPAKKQYRWAVGGILLGLIWMSKILLGGPVLLVSGYFLYHAFQYNSNIWPELYQSWQESWLCNKCGNIYRHLG